MSTLPGITQPASGRAEIQTQVCLIPKLSTKFSRHCCFSETKSPSNLSHLFFWKCPLLDAACNWQLGRGKAREPSRLQPCSISFTFSAKLSLPLGIPTCCSLFLEQTASSPTLFTSSSCLKITSPHLRSPPWLYWPLLCVPWALTDSLLVAITLLYFTYTYYERLKTPTLLKKYNIAEALVYTQLISSPWLPPAPFSQVTTFQNMVLTICTRFLIL